MIRSFIWIYSLVVTASWSSITIPATTKNSHNNKHKDDGRSRSSPTIINETMPNKFEFVHTKIAQALQCPPINLQQQQQQQQQRSTNFLSDGDNDDEDCGSNGIFLQFPETATLNDLVGLAHECDAWIYNNRGHNTSMSNDDKGDQWHDERMDVYAVALAQSALLADDGDDNNNTTHSTTSKNNIMVATLLALNALESAIREATGYTTGKAPLLKTMLGEFQEVGGGIGHACRLLLLPTPGLNLRNLLWHGFVSELPRPWLSLVLVLTRLIISTKRGPTNESLLLLPPPSSSTTVKEEDDALIDGEAASARMIQDLSKVPEFARLLEFSARTNVLTRPPTLRRSEGEVVARPSNWLPPSHQRLYQAVVVPWIKQQQRPATCCALLSILLEHGLRLDWCHANERPEDRIARPRAFYVTLDGHGQRQVHDLLLHPYVLPSLPAVDSDRGTATNSDRDVPLSSNERGENETQQQGGEPQKNALIAQQIVPISTVALLTDLFCSSCGGPNLRAAVSHGLWDRSLRKEWTTTTRSSSSGTTTPQQDNDNTAALWAMVRLLLLAMESIASQTPMRIPFPSSSLQHQHNNNNFTYYRPVFSYTAVTRRALVDCETTLQKLAQLSIGEEEYDESSSTTTTGFHNGHDRIPPELQALQEEIVFLQVKHPLLLLRETTTTTTAPSSIDNGGNMTYESYWNSRQSVWDEHALNEQLATMAMTRSLLQDVAVASRQLLDDVQEAIHELEKSNDNNSEDKNNNSSRSSQTHVKNETTKQKRKQKQWRRMAHSSRLVGLYLYTLAYNVAVLSLVDQIGGNDENHNNNNNNNNSLLLAEEDDAIVLLRKKALQRTRMVVSTTHTFLKDKEDRARKSIVEFTKGKAIRQVAARIAIVAAAEQRDDQEDEDKSINRR